MLYFHIQSKEGSPYNPLAPTQAPINPPYKTACEVKKGLGQPPPSATMTVSSSDHIPMTSKGEKELNSRSKDSEHSVKDDCQFNSWHLISSTYIIIIFLWTINHPDLIITLWYVSCVQCYSQL